MAGTVIPPELLQPYNTPQQQLRRKHPMMPVVAEIAKAYQSDPRTTNAQALIDSGSSTAPVAQGGYGVADGIARALRGAIGGYVSRRQMKKYGEREEAYRADMQKTAAEMLASQQAQQQAQQQPAAPAAAVAEASQPPQQAEQPQMAQSAPQAPAGPPAGAPVDPATASKIASALGGAQAPAAPPQAPGAPPTDPLTLQALMSQGGPVGSARPFSAGSSASTRTPAPLTFVDPLNGAGIPTSGYGPRKAPVAGASTNHNGQDYAAPAGTPVLAAADGKVIRAWVDPQGGNSILVRHPDGSTTGYAHLSDFKVQRGDNVQAGQPIGGVGSTGKATGNNLHFTYRDPSGKRQNPTTALKFGQPVQAAAQQGGTPASAEPVPNEPAAMARPDAPTAEPATQSKLLDAAYRMLANGNIDMVTQARDMLDRGLSGQTELDEAATKRRQAIKDTTYQADMNMYGDDRSRHTQFGLDSVRDVRAHNWQTGDREDAQQFTAGESSKQRAFGAWEAKYGRETQYGILDKQQNYDRWKTQVEIDARLQAAREAAATRKSSFFSTAAGSKIVQAHQQVLATNTDALGTLAMFEKKLKDAKTGGAVLGNASGIVKWSNADLQVMESMGNQLALAARQNMPGSLSDSDRQFLTDIVPNIRKYPRANAEIIARLRGTMQRQNEYAISSLEASAEGNDTGFMRDWQQYIQAVPEATKGPSYNEWKNRPQYDANGRKTN